MSANVGLSTPRGSGTSGYVQRNLSHIKKPLQDHRKEAAALENLPKHRQRQPDAEILEHERKRSIEIKCLELRDKLEEEGVDDEEIDVRVDKLRQTLSQQQKRKRDDTKTKFKDYEVHEMARRKEVEDLRVRRAFGIRKDYEEGGHWKRQESKKKDLELKREKEREIEEMIAKAKQQSLPSDERHETDSDNEEDEEKDGYSSDKSSERSIRSDSRERDVKKRKHNTDDDDNDSDQSFNKDEET